MKFGTYTAVTKMEEINTLFVLVFNLISHTYYLIINSI